jgi:hypothetical protein
LKPKTVFDFTREKSQQLAKQRKGLTGEALKQAVREVLKVEPWPNTESPSAVRGDLRSAVSARSGDLRRAQLKVEPPARTRRRADPPAGTAAVSVKNVPDFRILRYLRSRRFPLPHAITYAVETEPGIQAIVYRLSKERLYSRPPRGGKQAILYVSHLSSDAELRTEPLIKEIIEAEPDAPLFTCDVRGTGESQPDTCGVNSFLNAYGSDYFYAIHSLMLDRPYLGQKTYDVVRVLDWLASVGHTEVHLVGKGRGALVATFAALLSDTVRKVTLKETLPSYTSIAESEDYDWPLSMLLPNVLAHFDLPDCYGELGDHEIRE